jgi:hypothetical protein
VLTSSRQTRRGSAGRTNDWGAPLLCECADPDCFEAVMLSIAEYEQVRQHPSRFLLVAGHEDPEAAHERIVEAENGYAIVEKVGQAGLEAARLDDRNTAGP